MNVICLKGQVHFQMILDFHDIRHMFQVLQSVGVKLWRTPNGFMIDVRNLTLVEPCTEAMRKLRSSFFVIGSILGWKGEAVVPLPGGYNIGTQYYMEKSKLIGSSLGTFRDQIFGFFF
jgi:UDP-N-acetylglucosamine 1-carboxyvinyltransferase